MEKLSQFVTMLISICKNSNNIFLLIGCHTVTDNTDSESRRRNQTSKWEKKSLKYLQRTMDICPHIKKKNIWTTLDLLGQTHFNAQNGLLICLSICSLFRSLLLPKPPRSATFFRGDWSWNIFYGHSLPSTDSRRAVVSFWRKNVHNTG